MSCQYAHHDGAYVLGALSPAERQEFEQHLAGCVECTRAVRELAGMPGLLARVDRDVLQSTVADEPVPETLLPGLLRQVRRTQRRRTWVTAGVAAAAAVAVALGSLTVSGAFTGESGDPSPAQPSVTVPTGAAMVPVGGSPVSGNVTLASVDWGTRLELTCSYPVPREGGGYQPHDGSYSLVVRTRDGRTEQIATWRPLPGRTMQLTAATAASRQDIVLVQVRTADGQPVLELAL